MNIESKSSHNSVLLDFDSLVDIRFGVIRYLRNMYSGYFKSSYIPKFINKDFLLNQDLSLLLRMRVFDGDDLIKKCFTEEYRDSALKIESDILNQDLKSVLELSPETSVVSLIKRFKDMADGSVKSYIFCTEDIKYDFIFSKEYNKYSSVRKYNSLDKINLDDYTRIILSDYRKVKKFNNPTFKSIVIMGYGENFTNKMEYGSLSAKMISDYSTNEFIVYNPYKNILSPIG